MKTLNKDDPRPLFQGQFRFGGKGAAIAAGARTEDTLKFAADSGAVEARRARESIKEASINGGRITVRRTQPYPVMGVLAGYAPDATVELGERRVRDAAIAGFD